MSILNEVNVLVKYKEYMFLIKSSPFLMICTFIVNAEVIFGRTVCMPYKMQFLDDGTLPSTTFVSTNDGLARTCNSTL
jgi:hypothetical protein